MTITCDEKVFSDISKRLTKVVMPGEFFFYEEKEKVYDEVLKLTNVNQLDINSLEKAKKVIQQIFDENWIFDDWFTLEEIESKREKIKTLKINAKKFGILDVCLNREIEVLNFY